MKLNKSGQLYEFEWIPNEKKQIKKCDWTGERNTSGGLSWMNDWIDNEKGQRRDQAEAKTDRFKDGRSNHWKRIAADHFRLPAVWLCVRACRLSSGLQWRVLAERWERQSIPLKSRQMRTRIVYIYTPKNLWTSAGKLHFTDRNARVHTSRTTDFFSLSLLCSGTKQKNPTLDWEGKTHEISCVRVSMTDVCLINKASEILIVPNAQLTNLVRKIDQLCHEKKEEEKTKTSQDSRSQSFDLKLMLKCGTSQPRFSLTLTGHVSGSSFGDPVRRRRLLSRHETPPGLVFFNLSALPVAIFLHSCDSFQSHSSSHQGHGTALIFEFCIFVCFCFFLFSSLFLFFSFKSSLKKRESLSTEQRSRVFLLPDYENDQIFELMDFKFVSHLRFANRKESLHKWFASASSSLPSPYPFPLPSFLKPFLVKFRTSPWSTVVIFFCKKTYQSPMSVHCTLCNRCQNAKTFSQTTFLG